MKTLLRIFCLLTFFTPPLKSQDLNHKTLPSESIIGLDESLKKAAEAIGMPLFFPLFIPGDQQYYAFIQISSDPLSVTLSFSADETCQGVKTCTVGSLHLKPGGVPEQRRDRIGKIITMLLDLSHGTTGYYTPGHARGDYWPPSLQWQEEGVLYDLWWSGMDESTTREALINMANSTIYEASQMQNIP